MPIIRSITLHIDNNVARLSEYSSILNRLKEYISKKGFNVWTQRISMPVFNGFNYDRYCSSIANSIKNNVFISALNVEYNNFDPKSILSCLSKYNLMFGSLLIRDFGEISEILDKIYHFYRASDDLLIYTRFSLLIGSWIQTPYFPSSPNIAGEVGFSIALRYTDLFKSLIKDPNSISKAISFLKKLNDLLIEVEELYGLKYYGIDLSLSPWMSESVAELIEIASGVKFPLPGSGYGIDRLNRLIRILADRSGIRTIGFNEVMIPVEEDDLLKARASKGALRFRDLIYLSINCIVGVDMAIVSRSDLDIGKVLYDLLIISSAKKRSIGIRVIPTIHPPGSRIDLGRFGSGTVLIY